MTSTPRIMSRDHWHPNAELVWDGWFIAVARYGPQVSFKQAVVVFGQEAKPFRRLPQVDMALGSTLRFLERSGLLAQVGRRRRGGPVYEAVQPYLDPGWDPLHIKDSQLSGFSVAELTNKAKEQLKWT